MKISEKCVIQLIAIFYFNDFRVLSRIFYDIFREVLRFCVIAADPDELSATAQGHMNTLDIGTTSLI